MSFLVDPLKRERIEFISAYNIDIKTITTRTDNTDKKKKKKNS